MSALPVSTRSRTSALGGVAAGVRELHPCAPGGLVLESTGRFGDAEGIVRAVREAGVPVLGVVAPAIDRIPGERLPTLDAGDATEREEARRALLGTVPLVARVRAARIIVGLGALATDGKGREAAAERVCRELFDFTVAVPGVGVALLPGPWPGGFFDLDTAGWILDDLGRRGVGLALDLGTVGLSEARGGPPGAAWLERHGGHLRLLLLSDHDGRDRSDLLPGAGVAEWKAWRDLLPRRVPWVARLDPTSDAADLRESLTLLREALGPLPETAAGA